MVAGACRSPEVVDGCTRRSSCDRKMTITGQFIADLQAKRRIGKIAYDTEQHLKHEFCHLGSDASAVALAAAVDAEINRLERQAATLRRLREALVSLAQMGH